MKPIRLILDYVPRHKAAREFTLKLFDDLVSQGVNCELVIIGLKRSVIPQVEIIKHPTQITEDIVTFMNIEISDRVSDPRNTEDVVLAWNRRILEIRGDLIKDPAYITIEFPECDGYYAYKEYGEVLVKSELRVTNAGGHKYFEHPIHNNIMEEREHESICDSLTRQTDSLPLEPHKETEELVQTLRIIQEKEIEIETLPESTYISQKFLSNHLSKK